MKQRIGIVIGVLGSIVVAALWWFLLWSPQTSALAEADDDLETAQSQRDAVVRRLATLEVLKANEPALRAEAQRLQQAVPDQPELDQFLLAMNDTAIKAGVSFPSISQSEPTAAAPMNVRVAVSGSYAQILDYIDRLNAMPRLVVIDTVTLGGSGEGAALELTAALSLRAFTAGVPAPAPAGSP